MISGWVIHKLGNLAVVAQVFFLTTTVWHLLYNVICEKMQHMLIIVVKQGKRICCPKQSLNVNRNCSSAVFTSMLSHIYLEKNNITY